MVQTCIRYAEDQRCRFCTIEESLREGATIAAKTPAQLAEVAEAAVGLDGVTQMVMTTGTTTGPAHPGPSPACGRLAARYTWAAAAAQHLRFYQTLLASTGVHSPAQPTRLTGQVVTIGAVVPGSFKQRKGQTIVPLNIMPFGYADHRSAGMENRPKRRHVA